VDDPPDRLTGAAVRLSEEDMKKRVSKLRLNRETLRRLEELAIGQVVGGVSLQTECAGSYCESCTAACGGSGLRC